MKPLIKNCTTNVQKILRDAEKYSYVHWYKGITWDDIVLATFSNAESLEHWEAFFALLWINKRNKLSAYINFLNQQIEDIDFKEQWIWTWKINFDKDFEKQFNNYKKWKWEKRDILSILDIWMKAISVELKQLFKLDKINCKLVRSTIQELSNSAMIQEVGFLAFLEIIDTLVCELNLDYSEIKKMHVSNKKDWINNLLDNLESEIVEKEDNDNISLETDSSKPKKKEEKKLTIEYFWTDLTKEARDGYLDPIIWREKEIDQVIYTLLRKTKNNPLLIWEAWVWKTAIVEGLVQRINAKEVPEKLQNKKVFLLDMWTLVAWTKYRGEFESRMKSILEEAMDPTNNIILFIDELHTIIWAWGQDQNDAAQMLKPLLSRWKIKLIGATTFDEYQKYIEKDAALKRRFQEVVVNEPTIEMTKNIIMGLKATYEDFHWVVISDEAIDKAITLSKRYILNKQLPDKALDILDEASARKSTIQQKLDNDDSYKKQEARIEAIQKEIEKAIENQDYFSAAELKEEEQALKKELQKIRSNKNIPAHLRSVIEPEDIWNVLADKTGIPTNIVNEDEITKLKRLDNELKKEIIGQNDAVDTIVKTLIRSRLSVIKKDKPIGSFLFLGPSGVWKTYLAKLIAKNYFWDETAMIRFDMSEYMEKFSVSKLIWSPAGYVGYDEWWWLTEAVKRKPYSVILLDEIEKAAPDVLNILLQILDEGQLKDSKGRRIDFKNTIIVMTSNIWTEEFSKKKTTIGFDTWTKEDVDTKQFNDVKNRVLEELKNHITPELSNRIDHKIVFKPLSKENLTEIFNNQIKKFLEAWKENKQVQLPKFTKAEVTKIIDKIYDPAFWARPIERYINDEIEPKIINSLLK